MAAWGVVPSQSAPVHFETKSADTRKNPGAKFGQPHPPQAPPPSNQSFSSFNDNNYYY